MASTIEKMMSTTRISMRVKPRVLRIENGARDGDGPL
jgi:hypothetical protein